MASCSKKLRVLLIPFFATSHIEPFTDLAIRLAGARLYGAVEVTVAVTPANVSIVQSLLERRRHSHNAITEGVKTETYPFPAVDGLPEGVENPSKAATPAESSRIDMAATSHTLMRPAQETLIRAHSPDAIVTDVHFSWNAGIAADLGVPCVVFSAIGAFSILAMRHIGRDHGAVVAEDENAAGAVVTVPRFPDPLVRIPMTELPEFLRTCLLQDAATRINTFTPTRDCFGLAVNTSLDLEPQYCEMFTREGQANRAYFLGPLSLEPRPRSPLSRPSGVVDSPCIEWLDSKPSRSVVYLCFGSLAHVSNTQLDELALGLEASGKPFLWVVRAAAAVEGEWTPPEGWKERVGDRGLLVETWAPQTAILGHTAVGAFVTHCGWNSVLETVAAGVPVLTWPMVFEQFITERLVTEVLGIGERLWPDGAGLRSTRFQEHELVPAEDVARALTRFMCPGGPGDAARKRVMDLAAECHAAMAEGGSSHRDLCRLVDDLIAASSKRS